jgi:hypothetical protein
MSNRIAFLVALTTLGVSASALAQAPTPTDLTFTATGTRCEDVNRPLKPWRGIRASRRRVREWCSETANISSSSPVSSIA